MKWFDQWFYRKCKDAWENSHKVTKQATLASAIEPVERDDVDWHDGLNIRLKRVNGGFIINFRKYDRVKDRHHENIYIITDEVDFNHELCKFITLESMR